MREWLRVWIEEDQEIAKGALHESRTLREVVEAIIVETPDPHGQGFLRESKEFCAYYLWAKGLQNRRQKDEQDQVEQQLAAERARAGMTPSGLYVRPD